MKSLILFVGLLAGVLIGPYAGRVIDSHSKKAVLIYSGVGRMISVCFMFLALYFQSVGWMLLFAVIIQISAAFYFPAIKSLIPMIVEEKELMSMNGIHMNVATIARVLGTALAGLLLAIMSLYLLYVFSLIAYGLLLASTFLLKVHETEQREDGKPNNRNNFREVIPILKKLPIVMIVLGLTLVPSLFIGGFNLVVINVSELQHDPQIKGLLYAVEGTCFILGALAASRLFQGRDQVKLILVFSVLIAIAQLSLFLGDQKAMSLLSFGLFGFGAGCFFPAAATIFQIRIPKEYHGRFFSFQTMLDRVLFQIVLLGTGLFLDTIGMKKMVLLFGTASLLFIFYCGVRLIKFGR